MKLSNGLIHVAHSNKIYKEKEKPQATIQKISKNFPKIFQESSIFQLFS